MRIKPLDRNTISTIAAIFRVWITLCRDPIVPDEVVEGSCFALFSMEE
jgi:hypothetical protein